MDHAHLHVCEREGGQGGGRGREGGGRGREGGGRGREGGGRGSTYHVQSPPGGHTTLHSHSGLTSLLPRPSALRPEASTWGE